MEGEVHLSGEGGGKGKKINLFTMGKGDLPGGGKPPSPLREKDGIATGGPVRWKTAVTDFELSGIELLKDKEDP